MIAFSRVTKRYPGGYEALRGISINIQPGEMVFVTGHSGAGKSTLLKLMAAIERPTGGTVIVNGQNVGTLRPSALPFLRRNFGLIFQDHKLLFDRSAYDNVALPLSINGYDRREAARRVRAALDKVGLLGREKANPVALSGGEQQRLAIARAIVHRPAILLADEPTGNLDSAYAAELGDLFKSFNLYLPSLSLRLQRGSIKDEERTKKGTENYSWRDLALRSRAGVALTGGSAEAVIRSHQFQQLAGGSGGPLRALRAGPACRTAAAPPRRRCQARRQRSGRRRSGWWRDRRRGWRGDRECGPRRGGGGCRSRGGGRGARWS